VIDPERRESLPVFPALFFKLAISAITSSFSPIFIGHPALATSSCLSLVVRWDAGPTFFGGRGLKALPLKNWSRCEGLHRLARLRV